MVGVSLRVWRAVALVALAAIAIAMASVAYFRATSPATKPNTGTASINPLFVTSDEVTYNFLTPALGWAVANVVRTGQFRVFRTIDGGEHWQKQLVGVRDFAGFGFSPISVQFFDKNRGFLTIGGSVEQLYRSRDGGSNWAPVRLPSARVDAITFSDPSNGWLLVGGQAWELLVTHDAGDTWQRLADPPVDLYGLNVRSPTEAWMGSEGFHLRHLYSSHDGGQSWQRHDLPPPSGQSWADGTYFQASVDLLPGGGVVAVVGPLFPFEPASALFTSFDSGITWRYVLPAPGEVAYQDSLRWWAMKGTALWKSSDGGQKWTKITAALPDWQYVPHVLDSKHAWASLYVVGGFGLALTNDGGLHWTRARVPSSD